MRSRKKSKTSKRVLTFLAVFLISFVAVMVITYWKFQSVPDTLIECVLDISKYESLALATIKITKVVRGEKDV